MHSKTNPFTPVAYFHSKLRVFLEDFFVARMGIEFYFGKIEFQSRGSIHVHFLMWHRERSCFTKNGFVNAAEIVKFTDRYISAINPNLKLTSSMTNEELLALHPNKIIDVIQHANKLINIVGRHTMCGDHCMKKKKCRFGFPKCLQSETKVVLSTGSTSLELD